MSWTDAFLAQARSDDEVRRLLAADPAVAPCHALHYLQMSTEKLAKAVDAMQSDRPPVATHLGLVRLLQQLKNATFQERLGYGRDTQSFRRLIDSLLPLARRIELLAPAVAGANQPNAEYPWLDAATGRVVAPADFAFDGFGVDDSPLTKLDELLAALLRLDL